MKRLLCFMICLPFITMAQDSENGIKWTTGLSWEQVKQKAKKENKYIFLDCYTTWCAPCKKMDKEVYSDENVGKYFNDKFISVKVQMDKTEKDDEKVQKWYDDVAAIRKQYDIVAFPSFLFLNPQGSATDLQIGYKSARELMNIAQISLLPGRVYKARPEVFNNFVAEYRKGNINYKELPSMIQLASRLDTALRSELMDPYKEYLSKLGPKEKYTKENIEFWASLNLSSKSQFFQYFLKDGKEIDKVMGHKGYSVEIIDKTIYYELLVPFFEEQNKNSVIPMTGMYLTGFKTDSSEADWNKLERMIGQKFNKATAKRNVLTARIEWYARHWNNLGYIKYSLVQLEKYPPEIDRRKSSTINTVAWKAFEEITDKKVLNGYIKWMEKVVASYPTNTYFLDTYGNLLYKVGRRQEAILWEEKAASLSEGTAANDFKDVIEQMKKGEATYDVTPIVDYKNSNGN